MEEVEWSPGVDGSGEVGIILAVIQAMKPLFFSNLGRLQAALADMRKEMRDGSERLSQGKLCYINF